MLKGLGVVGPLITSATSLRRLGHKLICGWLCLVFFVGCGSHRRVVQLQSDNERLLAEYRAQRDQNKDLAQKNAILEARVAESEKMLAQLNRTSGSRISMLDRPQLSAGNFATQSPANAGKSPASVPGSADPAGQGVELKWKPVRK